MAKVSIVIPTYNRADRVCDSISSVLAQTEKDLELIVVDDGSTDNTRQVIENIPDSRVRYIWRPNGGPAAARNTGLDHAQGDFIAFLDSDDYWPHSYLEKMLSALQTYPDYGMAYASIVQVNAQGQSSRIYKEEKRKFGCVTRHLFYCGFVSPVAVLIRRNVLSEFYFDEALKTAEDSDFFLRLSLRTKYLYVPQVIVSIRVSKDSLRLKTGLNYNRILSLERFYFRCGGNRHVPFYVARKKLSHQYRKIAEQHRRLTHKKASVFLYQEAIKYWPLDIRLYAGLIKSFLLKQDADPQWEMPRSLQDIPR